VGDLLVLEERRVTRDWSWVESRWTFVRAEGTGRAQLVEVDLSHRLYSAAELCALLESVGFGPIEVFGDLAGSPYDQEAKRLVAVARKSV
jgi:hypothetical protein